MANRQFGHPFLGSEIACRLALAIDLNSAGLVLVYFGLHRFASRFRGRFRASFLAVCLLDPLPFVPETRVLRHH